MKQRSKYILTGAVIGLLINFIQPVAFWMFEDVIINRLLGISITDYGYGEGQLFVILILIVCSVLFYTVAGIVASLLYYALSKTFSKTAAVIVLVAVLFPFLMTAVLKTHRLYLLMDAGCGVFGIRNAACLAEYAAVQSHFEYCDLSNAPDFCYMHLASKTLDLDHCALMNGYTSEIFYGRDVSPEIQECQRAVYGNLAILKRDTKYCDLAESMDPELFYLDFCYGRVAAMTDNPVLCSQFSDTGYDACVAASQNDKYELCGLLWGDYKQQCISDI